MLRLLIGSCLLVGAAVAKPSPLRQGYPYGAFSIVHTRHIPLVSRSEELPLIDAVPYQEDLVPLPAGDDEDLVPLPGGDELLPLDTRAPQTLPPNNYLWRSPNYPSYYPNGVTHVLTLQGDQGQDISIKCDPFDVEFSTGCAKDYLEINGLRYCGRGVLGPISAPQLAITFRSDWSGTAGGFSCAITVPSATATTTPAPVTSATTTQAPAPGGCRCGQRQSGRVVGGTEAAIGAFPWQAGLVLPSGTRTFCGGSVINNRYVLTAAHCTEGDFANPGSFQVLLGDHNIGSTDAGEQRYSVVQIIDHPSYTDASVSGWDFSLLKLDRDITYSSTIQSVCLAEAGQTYAGASAIASGFGKLGKDDPQATALQQITLPVWSESDCKSRWGTTIKSSMICAGGKSSGGEGVCMGDSGGPLVTQVSGSFRLIGVVSFGQPCAIADSPDVFARVSEALSWIATNTADAQYCSP